MSDKQKYRVHGYCLVPCSAEVEVRASCEAEALEKAKALFAKDKAALIDSNSCDTDAAFDWQPSAEPLPKL